MGMLDNRVAIITGAAGGIGSATVRRFAEEGARLVVTDLPGDRLDQVGDEVAAAGGVATVVPADVARPDQIEAVVQAAIDAHGRIDALVNIAQGGLDQHSYLDQVTVETATVAFNTGPLQSLLFMQHCLPHMKSAGYGRIINTGSHSAVLGQPGFSAYEMAKGAVMALTRNAAKEWAEFGIVTNTFLPVIRTAAYDLSEQGKAAAQWIEETNPTRRFGTAYEDCAPVLAFLASEGARYLNGQVIGIDGGMNLLA